jgi:hypothetical protein
MTSVNRGVNPRDVQAPRANWQLIDVLYESEHWSLALGRWRSDGEVRPVLAQRWNGGEGEKGNPTAHGHPTWFVVPDDTYPLYLDSEFIPQVKRPFVIEILGTQATKKAAQPAPTLATLTVPQLDTVIVPAREDGFEETFLGENCWYEIRIGEKMREKIKYISGYRSSPIAAITHYAPVDRIEPYGEAGKYKLIFAEPAKPIGPIPFGDAPSGSMQGPRYTSLQKLLTAKKLTDLF